MHVAATLLRSQSLSLSEIADRVGYQSEVEKVRAGGLEPPRALHSTDFRTVYGFRRRAVGPWGHVGEFAVWTIPSPCPGSLRLGAARLVSTPSRLECSGQVWLGIAMSQGSPNLGSSASPVSRRALKFWLKSVASAIPPRPHVSCAIENYHTAARRNLQRTVRAQAGHQGVTERHTILTWHFQLSRI